MKDNEMVKKLFGKKLMDVMNEKLDEMVKEKYDVEKIYTYLKDTNESVRVGLYVLAKDKGLDNVAESIKKVNEMLNVRRKKSFLAAYKNGEMDKFLATLGKADKIALMADLEVDGDLQQRVHFTEEQREFYKILSESIMNDQENEERDGIDQFVTYKKEEK